MKFYGLCCLTVFTYCGVSQLLLIERRPSGSCMTIVFVSGFISCIISLTIGMSDVFSELLFFIINRAFSVDMSTSVIFPAIIPPSEAEIMV